MSPGTGPALQTAPGAHHFRFIGVEFTVAPAVTQNYGRFQWSPDGRVLAVGRSAQVISFIDLQGRVLATNAAGGLPDAWTP